MTCQKTSLLQLFKIIENIFKCHPKIIQGSTYFSKIPVRGKQVSQKHENNCATVHLLHSPVVLHTLPFESQAALIPVM